MRKLVPITMLFFLVLTLLSCASAPSRPSKYAISLSLKDKGGFWQSSDSFGAGETPVVAIFGYGGETITRKIYNLSTGLLLHTDTAYISKGNYKTWRFPGIETGSYKVDFLLNGSTVESVNFSVSK